MYKKLIFAFTTLFLLISIVANGQSSEIIKLDEKNSYQYKSYYEDGSIESTVGFYVKKPYSSIQEFEAKLKAYKIKYHGERKEFYPSGQLKEIVVYKKGKVKEFMKQYFEDGEEFSVGKEDVPQFNFNLKQSNEWLVERIQEVEKKYQVNINGKVLFTLDISKDGTVKESKVIGPNEVQKKYLLEVVEQIKIVKPAMKNGQAIGTKFFFRVEL